MQAESIPTKKRRDHADKDQGKIASDNQVGCSNSFSIFSSRTLPIEKDREELIALKERVEDLQRKLLEKEELLKLAEISKTQMTSMNAKFEELKHQAVDKDSLIKSTQLRLSDAKNSCTIVTTFLLRKFGDKQQRLEKLQWEAMTSNKNVEKLQEDLGLTKNHPTMSAEDYDVTPYHLNHLPHTDDWDETEMQKMEEAREAYVAIVAAAKEKQDKDSIAAAATARLHLQSFVFRKSEQPKSLVGIPSNYAKNT
ncbi:Protein MICROTUBULE BINDING PROTEIN 2C [Camellia lanceoleosa]|uniref:Protein MICROTUBULE BINDING PROTEIN 2C n=1 Tax=Camellia lanceoleosa TaxID=1840588 RepID=A0ACC0F8K4_9ERIC|nr:Protein MICROTUBULE BINDING PROTEIN 2C [Camellia lanceoleosa]